MPISILSTLKEAFLLCARNYGLVVSVALFIGLPHWIRGDDLPKNLDLSMFVEVMASAVLGLILDALATAAVLNILCRKTTGKTWLIAMEGVRNYTVSLVGVSLLLILILLCVCIPIELLITMLGSVLGFGQIRRLMVGFILMLLSKYSLANPVVVAEDFEAGDALIASWRMTRRHLWFVLGCYVISGGIVWLIQTASELLTLPSAVLVFVRFFYDLFNTYWIVLSWVMYIQIKAADGAGRARVQVIRPFG